MSTPVAGLLHLPACLHDSFQYRQAAKALSACFVCNCLYRVSSFVLFLLGYIAYYFGLWSSLVFSFGFQVWFFYIPRLFMLLFLVHFIHVSLLMFRFLIHFYSCFPFILLLILVYSPLIFSGLIQFLYFLSPLFQFRYFRSPFSVYRFYFLYFLYFESTIPH